MCCKGKKESGCESFKTRSVLCILILGLLAISGAFIYTALSVTNPNTTMHTVPTKLSNTLNSLEHVSWCLNSSIPDRVHTSSKSRRSTSANISSTPKHSACLQLVIIIPGDYYPILRNQSLYAGSIERSQLITDEKVPTELLDLTFYLQHNLSTSTRYSRDVLVPSFINISSPTSLPDYILDASSCQLFPLSSYSAESVSPCSLKTPHFHVDKRWNIDLDVYVSMTDRNQLHIHLMYTSYFLLIMAMSAMVYSLCRSRGSSRSKVMKRSASPLLV